jgi:chaperonin cofactor prefoldin
MENDLLNKIEIFTTKFITNKNPESVVYHDISFTQRLVSAVKVISENENVSEDENELLLVAAWIYGLGYYDAEAFGSKKINSGCIKCTIRIGKPFLEEVNYPQENIDTVYIILENTKHPLNPTNKIEQIFADALFYDFAREKGEKYLKKMYQELLIFHAIGIGKKKWNDELIKILENHTYFTTYGKSVLEPKKHKLIKELKKEAKALISIQDTALKKELEISDRELKNLKESLSENNNSVDIRTIQTLFRNTSRNHYTLNQMVDRKANIMISINAIINSLLIGGIIGPSVTILDIKYLPAFFLIAASLISIFYAILAIIPNKTHGEFTEEEIRNKQNNLLYFGNFHNMSYRDYEWAMLEMITDKDYLYSSLIKDIYYLGEKIKKKHSNIRKSLLFFLIGTVVSVISFLVIKLLVL